MSQACENSPSRLQLLYACVGEDHDPWAFPRSSQATRRQPRRCSGQQRHAARCAAAAVDGEVGARQPVRTSAAARRQAVQAPMDVLYDAVIVGGGMGGLTVATQMAAKGAKVLVLEK